MTPQEAFQRLGLQGDATVAAVRAAYRAEVWWAHPDQGGDTDQFQALTQALNIALAHAVQAPCPHCTAGKVRHMHGFSTVEMVCDQCHGTGRREDID